MKLNDPNRRPGPGVLLGVIALVLATTGAATALPGRNQVDRNDIRKAAVTAKAIKSRAVTTAKLAEGAVTAAKLAANSVSGSKLIDGTVTNTKLANAAVTESKLGDDAISRAKIRASAVTKPKLADQAVDSDKLADGAVTDAKVANLSYQALGLSNGFAVTAGLAAPSYAVDVEGVVHLRGAAVQVSSAGGSLATLPARVRPASPVLTAGVCGPKASPIAALVDVEPEGTIQVTASPSASQNNCEDTGFASLDGVEFPAAG